MSFKISSLLHVVVMPCAKVKDRGGVYRSIGKLFINSLYGRFGLNPKDELTIIITKEREEYYAHRFYITDRVEIDSNLLLTYSPKPILELYKLNNIFINYKKDMLTYKKSHSYAESNVAVAAAITSLGRIHLYNDMLAVSQHGGKMVGQVVTSPLDVCIHSGHAPCPCYIVLLHYVHSHSSRDDSEPDQGSQCYVTMFKYIKLHIYTYVYIYVSYISNFFIL